MRPEIVHIAGRILAVFFCLVAVEVVLLMIFAGSGANKVSAPLAENFSLLTTLWHSNPAAALPLMAQTPVFVIAHRDPVDSLQAWGLYFFPFTFAVHLAIAVIAAQQLRRALNHARQLLWLITGGAALAFAVTYTHFATCCTGGPRWALDVGLYALAFDPAPSLLEWSAIYTRIEAFLPYLQLVIGVAGMACIVVAALKQKSPD